MGGKRTLEPISKADIPDVCHGWKADVEAGVRPLGGGGLQQQASDLVQRGVIEPSLLDLGLDRQLSIGCQAVQARQARPCPLLDVAQGRKSGVDSFQFLKDREEPAA
jgi:hypothetical protein